MNSIHLQSLMAMLGLQTMVHVPKDQADDVNMDEVDDDDDDDDGDDDDDVVDDDDDVQEAVELLPTLQVIVGPQESSKKEEDVSSQEREETSQQAGHSGETEIPELNISRVGRPEDRYGHYVIRQLKPEHQELVRNMAFDSQNVLTQDDMEGRSPLLYEEIGCFSMLVMLEYLAYESHKNFMEIFAPSTRTDITDEQHHEFRLEQKRVLEANKNVTQDNFECCGTRPQG